MENSDMTPEEFKKAYEEGNFMEIFKELTKKLREQVEYMEEQDWEELEEVSPEVAELDYDTPKGRLAQDLDVVANHLSRAVGIVDELHYLVPDTPKWAKLKYELGEISSTLYEIWTERFKELVENVPEDTEGEWEF